MGHAGALNWETVARAGMHPRRLAILEHVSRPPPEGDPGWSAKTLAEALGMRLAASSHHVRALREAGLLEEVGTRRVRGALQMFYALSAKAVG